MVADLRRKAKVAVLFDEAFARLSGGAMLDPKGELKESFRRLMETADRLHSWTADLLRAFPPIPPAAPTGSVVYRCVLPRLGDRSAPLRPGDRLDPETGEILEPIEPGGGPVLAGEQERAPLAAGAVHEAQSTPATAPPPTETEIASVEPPTALPEPEPPAASAPAESIMPGWRTPEMENEATALFWKRGGR